MSPGQRSSHWCSDGRTHSKLEHANSRPSSRASYKRQLQLTFRHKGESFRPCDNAMPCCNVFQARYILLKR